MIGIRTNPDAGHRDFLFAAFLTYSVIVHDTFRHSVNLDSER